MVCKNCGTVQKNNQTHCHVCGAVVKEVNSYTYLPKPTFRAENMPKQKENSQDGSSTKILSVLGFVFSIMGYLVGFVLSLIALKKYKNQNNQSYRGFAVAGLVISSITLAISLIAGIFMLVMFLFVYNQDAAAFQSAFQNLFGILTILV